VLKMSRKSNYSLDEFKLFLAQSINDENDAHAKLINSIGTEVGNTSAGTETLKILSAVYKAKIDILHKIFAEAQKVQ